MHFCIPGEFHLRLTRFLDASLAFRYRLSNEIQLLRQQSLHPDIWPYDLGVFL